jgi:hypothetical protein
MMALCRLLLVITLHGEGYHCLFVYTLLVVHWAVGQFEVTRRQGSFIAEFSTALVK